MENRKVGYLIIVISAVIGFIIYSFNMAISEIVSVACSHGPECPMWGTLGFQTNISIGITLFIMSIGIYMVAFGKDRKVYNRVVKPQVKMNEITRDNFEGVLKKLDSEEKKVFESLIDERGSIFQSSLVEKTGLSKVKVTRLLDKLEGKGLLERKRRGMTNIVMIKY